MSFYIYWQVLGGTKGPGTPDFEEQPPMFKVSDTHYAATWLLHEQAPKVTPPAAVLRLRAKGGYTHE